jgi:alkylation response protein AidB-like acyl-CoA dehydrogenase
VRLRYRDEDEDFRRELREWLEANAPPEQQFMEAKLSSAHLPDWARAWQRRLFDAGWLVPGWPPELGGRNANAVQQMIYFEEMAAGEIPRSLNPQGLSIVTPSIVDHGTDDQRRLWALPTLRGEITWCLGMSEPGAGSDLASLSTRAVLDGDGFVVNGQKVWTSGAHHADWCLCFVRSDPAAPKHRGISALIIDMRSPGITCRPLPELTEPHRADFNEVFFTDVNVPAANLLGELHDGWRITQGSLSHERGMLWIANAHSVQRGVEELIELGRAQGDGRPGRPAQGDGRPGRPAQGDGRPGRPAQGDGRPGRPADDDVFRDRVASLVIDAHAITLLGYRGFGKFSRGQASPEHLLLKLYSSEVERRLYLTGVEALGAEAIDTSIPGPGGWREGAWAAQYLRSFSGTIAGGTSEIQRNILAERVLGLPRG